MQTFFSQGTERAEAEFLLCDVDEVLLPDSVLEALADAEGVPE